jgi:phosphoserine phosphatase
MDSVLVLIAAPGSRAIDERVAKVASRVAGTSADWLAEHEAVQFPLPWVPAFAGMTELVAEIGTRPIDAAVVPAADRKKRLLLADMDSTMIGEECIDELGELAGLGADISAITARAMAGELDFEGALRARVALLAGLDATAISEVITHRITFRPGGAALLATMKANGAHTALISGGFVQFTGYVADRLGFHEHRGNELTIAGGKLTGKVREPILGKDAKRAALDNITARLGLTPRDAITVGDGANDIPMLKAAGIGVALHAKPKVKAEAPVSINHGDLSALLYLQGYRREELVAAT